MGKVRTGLGVSLDGFMSGPNDGPEAPWGLAASGSWPGMALATPNTGCLEPTWSSWSRPRPPSSSARHARTGASVFGRRTFDLTHGWGGRHPWMSRSLWSAAQSHKSGSTKDHRSRSSPTDSRVPWSRPKRSPATRTSAWARRASCSSASGRDSWTDPRRPGARPARGRRQLLRPPRHRAGRPGAPRVIEGAGVTHLTFRVVK